MVGVPKAHAIRAVIGSHVLWTEVPGLLEGLRTQSDIQERILPADIVVATTGNEALVRSLEMVAQRNWKGPVTGTLCRIVSSLACANRRRRDMPMLMLDDLTRYQLVPAGPEGEEFAAPQMGSSTPVNNAPPAAVSACTPLLSQVGIAC